MKRQPLLVAAYPLVRRVLFSLDAETAHHATLSGLHTAARLGLAHRFAPPPVTDPVKVMGLTFPNRVGLAAGLDKAGECIDGFGALGFGHVEIGTVTPRPQPGNPYPRLFRLVDRQAIINRMGFNNPGLTAVLENAQRRTWQGVLGINLGKNFDTPNERAVDDYLAGLRGAYPIADYITINISSPNTKGLRDLQQEDVLRALLQALKQAQEQLSQQHQRYVPLAVKIAPDLEADALKAIAAIFLAQKIDAVIATNTTLSRAGVDDLPTSHETGGLSGAPLREKATAVLRCLHAEVGSTLPLIGAGGIVNGEDAAERFAAGASLVQLYTGLIYRGPALIAEAAEAGRRARPA